MKKLKLTVELVPSTCWYSNVRSEVPKEVWDKIRRKAYKKANYLCEICGGKGDEWPVECHEIWEYIDKTHIQKLVGFTAICPNCHEVKHIGRAEVWGNIDRAIEHLVNINEWSYGRADKYLEEVTKTYHVRSLYQWESDISYIDEYLNENNKRNSSKTT